MYKRVFPLSIALLLIFVFMIASSGASQAEAAPIRLKAANFTPALGERPAIPPGLAIAGYAQGQRGYYLVQFTGPVQQAWKDGVTAAGAELLDYIPDFAFKVRMNPAEATAVAQPEATS